MTDFSFMSCPETKPLEFPQKPGHRHRTATEPSNNSQGPQQLVYRAPDNDPDMLARAMAQSTFKKILSQKATQILPSFETRCFNYHNAEKRRQMANLDREEHAVMNDSDSISKHPTSNTTAKRPGLKNATVSSYTLLQLCSKR